MSSIAPLRPSNVDPLRSAGERLDAAAAALEKLCRAPALLPDEAIFGRAEAELLAARTAYRSLVAERLGDESRAIERRLAL